MITSDLYERFAELPLEERDKPIDKKWHGHITITDVYTRVKRLNDTIEPLQTERRDLLDLAEKFFAKYDE